MTPDFPIAESFLRDFGKGTARQRTRLLRQAPWPEIRSAALHHPDAATRRWLLFVLDHYDNDASTATFAEALNDQDVVVRGMALHSIACEPCKGGELSVSDVVPSLIATLREDPNARLRINAVHELLQLLERDERVRPALKGAASADPDPVVQHCASEALEGRFFRPRKTYERSQRRHAQSRPRS